MRPVGRQASSRRWPRARAALAAPALSALGLAGLGLAALGFAAPLSARSGGSVDVGGSLGLVSDYRFRGISNTDFAPAIQASAQLDTASGLFLGAWASNISGLDGASAEVDLSAGWRGAVAGVDTSVGVIGYLFPGGRGTDVVELFGSAGFALGPATATLGINWAPQQANLPRASRYAHAVVTAALPGRPLLLRASVGHEVGGLPLRRPAGAPAKWDWQLGLDMTLPTITIGIAYVGTDLPSHDPIGNRPNRLGRDGAVVRLLVHF